MTSRKSGADWSPEAVRRLWDWYGANPHVQDSYFTAMVGRGVAEFLSATGKLSGKALDYGCGPGHMIAQLLERGLECLAADSSPGSIRAVNERYAGRKGWGGGVVSGEGRLPFPDGSFDVVLCIETLEHMPDAAGAALLGELRRVMKPGGIGMLTVPCAEPLERNFIYCPFCEAEFHKWQHCRSFDAEALERQATLGGFDVSFCGSLDFGAFQRAEGLPPLRDLSAARFAAWLASARRRTLDRLLPRAFPDGRVFRHRLGGGGPHLCAVVTRRMS